MSRNQRRLERKRAKEDQRPPQPRAGLLREAVAHYHAGRRAEALAICLDVLAREPNRADLLGFAGGIALELGEHAQATALYRKALALRPDYPDVEYNLALALERSGALEAAAEAYRAALARHPDLVPAWHNLGTVLLGLGQPEEAVAAYRRALAFGPLAESERSLGIALERLGQLEEAVAAYRRALALKPDWSVAHNNLAYGLLALGDGAAALAACERWLEAFPASVEATALKALTLNEVGAVEEARALYDFDRFVQIHDLAAPPGYSSLAAFNADLVRHVEAHPTLKVPPEEHPTYHHPALEITEELLAEPKGPMAALESLMRAAVARYLASVPPSPPHPFLARFPERWTLTAWATRLCGWGNLVPHVHFDGYLGAVYYPLLPPVVTAEDGGEAGWFELGRPPEQFRLEAAPLIRRIQPKEGRLLLFPGYMYHNTVPFTAAERRISIAFDLVALA
ncbi:MAG TPA: tetratricopeptide repeat protein [Alphaproteobacteria bacterium]|nr:tetratricopeptide repeat protein [Alphaproteobacteria bacterium]